MKALAFVLINKKKIKLKEIEIPDLNNGQVLIKINYTSICHTQLQEINGSRGADKFLPHCLGHEATGVVIKTGPKVKILKKNDKVCLSWVPSSGYNSGGTYYYDKNKKKVNAGPVNTFSNYAVISENKIQKLKKGADIKKSVLLGCALPTAFNCIISNTSNVRKKNILIIGCGGVGLGVVYASKIKKFGKIYVIDKDSSKIKVSSKLATTHEIKIKDQHKYHNYFDYVVESSGNDKMLNSSIQFVKKFGGKLIVIGNYKYNKKFKIDPWQILNGKKIVGSWNKNFNYRNNFKKYEKLSKAFNSNLIFGKKTYNKSNFLKAINDFNKGKVIRPLIKFT